MSIVAAPKPIRQRGGDTELASRAKALGQTTRVQIVRLTLSRNVCVCGEILDELPIAQATVSQHLKVLREAGSIRGSRTTRGRMR